jgi:hypothetical protein
MSSYIKSLNELVVIGEKYLNDQELIEFKFNMNKKLSNDIHESIEADRVVMDYVRIILTRMQTV